MPIENMNFFTLSLTIFVLLNSYAQIPVFLSLLSDLDQKRQKIAILREMTFALIILFIFIFFGIDLLNSLGIKKPVLGIGGGFLLVIIALNMIFPKKESSTKGMPQHEPFIVPLAIPCIAGPGTITTIMVLAKTRGILMASGALVVAWIPSTILLLLSPYIKNYLGDKGLQAIEKLGGMIVMLIGIQMFSYGVVDFIKDTFQVF